MLRARVRRRGSFCPVRVDVICFFFRVVWVCWYTLVARPEIFRGCVWHFKFSRYFSVQVLVLTRSDISFRGARASAIPRKNCANFGLLVYNIYKLCFTRISHCIASVIKLYHPFYLYGFSRIYPSAFISEKRQMLLATRRTRETSINTFRRCGYIAQCDDWRGRSRSITALGSGSRAKRRFK